MAIKKATQRLINSVWTLEYEQIDESTIKILKYTRQDPEGYVKERELDRIKMIETDNRTVVGVHIGPYSNWKFWAEDTDPVFKVSNPDHVFSYQD